MGKGEKANVAVEIPAKFAEEKKQKNKKKKKMSSEMSFGESKVSNSGDTNNATEIAIKSEKVLQKAEKKQKKEKCSEEESLQKSMNGKGEEQNTTVEMQTKPANEEQTKKKKRKSEKGLHDSKVAESGEFNNATELAIKSEKMTPKPEKKKKKGKFAPEETADVSTNGKGETQNTSLGIQTKPANKDQTTKKKMKSEKGLDESKVAKSNEATNVTEMPINSAKMVQKQKQKEGKYSRESLHQATMEEKKKVKPEIKATKTEIILKATDSLDSKSLSNLTTQQLRGKNPEKVSNDVPVNQKNIPGIPSLVLGYLSRHVSESALNEFVGEFIVNENDTTFEEIFTRVNRKHNHHP